MDTFGGDCEHYPVGSFGLQHWSENADTILHGYISNPEPISRDNHLGYRLDQHVRDDKLASYKKG